MMKFFHPVATFSTTGKTEKGRILQEMAIQFDRVLIHGENSAIKLTERMREIAAVLDILYPRTRPTFIECHIDNKGCGQITASPVNKEGKPDLYQDYFRITFDTVDHAATIDEVLDRFTLSALKIDGKPFKKYQMPKDAKSAIYVPGKKGGDA